MMPISQVIDDTKFQNSSESHKNLTNDIVYSLLVGFTL